MAPISRRSDARENRPRDRRRRPSLEPLETRRLLTDYVVTSTADSGGGTLRREINLSNLDTAQPNVITFNLGGTGIQTISLLSALPAITQPVTIEGTTGQRRAVAGRLLTARGPAPLRPAWTSRPMTPRSRACRSAGSAATGSTSPAPATSSPATRSAPPRSRTGAATAAGAWRSPGRMISSSGRRPGSATSSRATAPDGVQIAGAGATGNVVQGNNLGLDTRQRGHRHPRRKPGVGQPDRL